MREILFRGKRVDNNEWVEGFYSPIRLPIVGEMGHFINEDGYRAIEIKKETVCEFTGLTDKNGNKIFEGDIVRNNKYGEDNDTYDYYLTIFSNGSFRAQYLDNLEYTPKIYDLYFEGYEVIGNIHDNPELLEENKCVL